MFHLHTTDIAQYHLGLFYSSSASGVRGELPFGLPGKHSEDIHAVVRDVAFVHESAHYLQDLALGACVNQDLLLDEQAGILFSAIREWSKGARVRCPLIRHWPRPDRDARGTRAAVEEIDSLLVALLSQDYEFDTHALAGMPATFTLSSIDLLEGIACAKTMHCVAACATEPEAQSLLSSIRSDIQILPEHLPERYSRALTLFERTIGRGFLGEAADSGRNWPYDHVKPTSRQFVDLAFIHVADLALHIPPIFVIRARIAAGLNSLIDFAPPIRYAKMLLELSQNSGFPDRVSNNTNAWTGELYDWFASRLSWPSYVETQGAWEAMALDLRDARRGLQSDGYRYRLIVERSLRPNNILYSHPVRTLAAQGVPCFHETPNGFKLIQHYLAQSGAFVQMPYEFSSFIDPWFVMSYPAKKWQNQPKDVSTADLNLETSRWQIYLQEIVFRSMCRSLQAAVLTGEALECPWSRGTCASAKPSCRAISSLDGIPSGNCALRPYVEHIGLASCSVVWQ